MGRWLEKLREKNAEPTPNALKELKEGAFCSSFSSSQGDLVEFTCGAEAETRRIASLPKSEQDRALREFDARCAEFDALTQVKKRLAISRAVPTHPRPPNPFDANHHPGAAWPVVLPDLGQFGHFVARRAGSVDPTGHGPTQLLALDDLVKQESQV